MTTSKATGSGAGRAAHVALFPGTFDPITNGHLDIIRRAVGLFDRVVVAIGTNPAKTDLFELEERTELVRRIVEGEGLAVEVSSYRGLTVDYAKRIGATVILRGMRNATDLAHEFQLALANRAIADLETVFIMSGEPYGYTSSSLIKQIASGGDVGRLSRLLPGVVIEAMKGKMDRLRALGRKSDGNRD